ncbi:hypothetical protein HH310_09945 [Actinoplanes sp. TBRC 11911]|uniref:hypothetical protein n=1 Tax=Actinoplanes sp. TBRC 11911 TaxID=2729386 RepID=UPI00145F4678|nr:hypothetical protein [Actinoplanes sp. TBRC 11911]NMO51511.1 hypothetical protein [Actinoplanes sp. TBRC 11911]
MPRLSWKAAGLVVATAAVLLVAACGGSSGSDSASPSGGNGGGGNNAFAAYVDCLNKNGVTISLPSGGPGQRGGRPSGGPRNRPSGGARPSGMPRPRPSGSFGGGRGFAGGFFQKPADVDDATWQKAQDACASVRPSFGPGGNRPGGGGAQNAAFQNCMKDHGVTDLQNLSTADPTVKKALDVCMVLRQARPSATPAA